MLLTKTGSNQGRKSKRQLGVRSEANLEEHVDLEELKRNVE